MKHEILSKLVVTHSVYMVANNSAQVFLRTHTLKTPPSTKVFLPYWYIFSVLSSDDPKYNTQYLTFQ